MREEEDLSVVDCAEFILLQEADPENTKNMGQTDDLSFPCREQCNRTIFFQEIYSRQITNEPTNVRPVASLLGKKSPNANLTPALDQGQQLRWF